MRVLQPARTRRSSPTDARLTWRTHALALTCAAVFGAVAFSLPEKAPGRIEQVTLPLPDPAPTLGSESRALGDAAERWRTAIVKPGDNLSLIFSRLGLRTEDLYSLISAGGDARRLEQVHPGQVLRVRIGRDGGLQELVHEVDEIRGLRVVREDDIFRAFDYTHEIEKRTAFGSGIIRSSLYQAANDTGLSDKVVMNLAGIFGWDIDYANDLRPGDSFTVVYEQDFVSGEHIGDGEILAAEFVNQGVTYRAIRYSDAEGVTHYYTPEGRGMRQAFVRTPVDFRRISSRFRPQRWHPVLGVKRPHRGVDFAAATGTPVKAAGDGRVHLVGRKGGYGNTVILEHHDGIRTLYAHLSGFARGLRRGQRVEQGEVIGYVGSTGLATGPHLHYEFLVNGVHKDPMTVKLPGAPPLDRRYMADFRKQASVLTAQLDVFRRTRLAMITR